MIEIQEINASQTWDIRHRVMWPDMPFDYVKLPKDDSGMHYGLFEDKILKAIISVFYEDDTAQFRKLATEKAEQGRGFGSQLIQYVIKEAKAKKATKLWCNARTNKAEFYQKFGLEKTNETYSKGGIDFVVLEKQLKA
jgi:predicted GNAT family N-acyltransferase